MNESAPVISGTATNTVAKDAEGVNNSNFATAADLAPQFVPAVSYTLDKVTNTLTVVATVSASGFGFADGDEIIAWAGAGDVSAVATADNGDLKSFKASFTNFDLTKGLHIQINRAALTEIYLEYNF